MLTHHRTTWIEGGLGLAFAALLAGLAGAAISTVWEALPTTARSDDAWRDLWLDPAVRQATLRSLAVVLLASGLAGLVATPLAFVAAHGRPIVRFAILALGLLPIAMPPFVTATLMDGLSAYAAARVSLPAPLGDDQRALSVLVMTYALQGVPIVLLSLFIGLRRLDRSLGESARSHGVPDLITGYRITLPMLTPPFALAIAFLAARILGDAGAPLVLGRTDLLAPLLLEQIKPDGPSARGAQLAVLLTGFHALIFAFAWPYLLAPKDAAAPPQPARRTSASATLIALLFVAGLSLAPLVWLVARTDWAQVVTAMAGSAAGVMPGLSVPAVAAVALVALGLPTAILTRLPGVIGGIVRLTTALLFAVPGLLFAIGLTSLSASSRFVGGVAAWPTVAAALAVVLPLLPLVPHLAGHVSLRPDRASIDLARGLGVSPGRLTLRLRLPGIALLSVALASIGAALGLMEVTTLLASRPGVDPSPALDLIGSVVTEPMGRQWTPSASVMTGITVTLLACVAASLSLGSRARRPHRRRRLA